MAYLIAGLRLLSKVCLKLNWIKVVESSNKWKSSNVVGCCFASASKLIKYLTIRAFNEKSWACEAFTFQSSFQALKNQEKRLPLNRILMQLQVFPKNVYKTKVVAP